MKYRSTLHRSPIVGSDLHTELGGKGVYALAVIHRRDNVFGLGDVLAAKSLQQDAAHFPQSKNGQARWLR